METEQELDTSRTVVKTYVPAYQKERWERHADDLEMSTSEFVRSMIQAGRHGFTDGTSNLPENQQDDTETAESSDGIESRVVSILAENEHCSWEELVAELTDNIEDRLDEALGQLQAESRVRHSGRHDGYTLVEASK